MAGLAAALLVGAAGFLLTERYEAPWTATASLLVLPDDGLEPGLAATFYEQLSSGRVVQTYAQLLQAQQFLPTQGPPAADGPAPEISFEPVTDTSLLRIRVTASSPVEAERTADRLASRSAVYLDTLEQPYQLFAAASAGGTAERSGLGRPLLLVVVGAIALSVGLVVQQLSRLVGVLARAPAGLPEREPSLPPEAEQEPSPDLHSDSSDSTQPGVARAKQQAARGTMRVDSWDPPRPGCPRGLPEATPLARPVEPQRRQF